MWRSRSSSQAEAVGRTRFTAERWSLILLTPIIVYLVMANLGRYPTIGGWDEGIFLQFASNLANYGEYATRNGEVFERMMPLASVGPTVIVPAGLALLFGDNSLTAARAVSAIYLFAAVAGVYLLVRSIGGWESAIVGVFFFLIAGYDLYDTLWIGRQVLGEVPALAFSFLGIWAWLKSWRGSSGWLILGAVLIALAVITKNQLIWLLGPGVALVALVDRLHHRQLRLIQAFAPLAGIVLGYGASLLFALWIVGPSGRAGYLEAMSIASTVAFQHTGPHRWLTNIIWYGRLQWLIAAVTIGYGFYSGRARSLEGLRHLVIPFLAVSALLGFVGLSFPWPRNLHLPLVFVALCSALLLGDLARWVGTRWSSYRLWVVAALILLVGGLAAPRLVQNVQRIAKAGDFPAERFAAMVDEQVPTGSRILNWEWDIEFYSRRAFIHPPYQRMQVLFDQIFNQRHHPVLDESCIAPEIEYLIVGPFGEQTQVFARSLSQREHRLVGREGPFSLYRLD